MPLISKGSNSTLYVRNWEQYNNPNFNYIEFDVIKNQAGSNSFSLTPNRWVEATHEHHKCACREK